MTKDAKVLHAFINFYIIQRGKNDPCAAVAHGTKTGETMKYMLLTAAAITAVFGLSFLIAGLIRRKMKKKPPMWAHVFIGIGTGLLIFCAVGFGYLSIHYTAQDEALAVLSDHSGVSVSEIDGGYKIDSSGEKTAMIFYPGAKVDATAYLPLMQQIAESGIDCYLLKTPFRMPIFDKDAADRIIANNHYDTWLLSGHSMGGLIASSYAAEHADTVDGVVLLAAYPTKKLSDSLKLLSVYGTEDSVLEQDVYLHAKQYFPTDFTEKIIDGGNHAGFGNYGPQKGDGKATITAQDQQTQTAFAIRQFADTFQ